MWQAPEAGDIVWCRFPQRPRDKPGPKPRPALVVSVAKYDDGISVTVAYGTSKKLDRMLSGEFAIRKATNSAAFAMAGLSFDTKFNLRNMVNLPWNENFFGVPPDARHGQTPKMGSLHPCMMKDFAGAARVVKQR